MYLQEVNVLPPIYFNCVLRDTLTMPFEMRSTKRPQSIGRRDVIRNSHEIKKIFQLSNPPLKQHVLEFFNKKRVTNVTSSTFFPSRYKVPSFFCYNYTMWIINAHTLTLLVDLAVKEFSIGVQWEVLCNASAKHFRQSLEPECWWQFLVLFFSFSNFLYFEPW